MKVKVTYKRIKSHPKYRVGSDGSVWRWWPAQKFGQKKPARWKKLKQSPTFDGYGQVTLSLRGSLTTKKVHQLVLEAFVGPCPIGEESCHRNGNRQDNRRCNLYWGTPKKNGEDRIRHGKHVASVPRGSVHHNSKVTEEDVIAIRKVGFTTDKIGYWGYRRLMDKYGLKRSALSEILNRKTWKHI